MNFSSPYQLLLAIHPIIPFSKFLGASATHSYVLMHNENLTLVPCLVFSLIIPPFINATSVCIFPPITYIFSDTSSFIKQTSILLLYHYPLLPHILRNQPIFLLLFSLIRCLPQLLLQIISHLLYKLFFYHLLPRYLLQLLLLLLLKLIQ
jgi:hypothetical protein